MVKFQPQTRKKRVEIAARNIRPGHVVLINRVPHLVSEVQFDPVTSHLKVTVSGGIYEGMFLEVTPDEKLFVEANEGRVVYGRDFASNNYVPMFVEHEGAPHYVVSARRLLNLETLVLTPADNTRYYPLLEVVKT